MRQIIEIVVLAALLIVLSVYPGYAQGRAGANPDGAIIIAAEPKARQAAFDAFLLIDGIDGETDDGGGGGSTPHCYEDEELQMSICE